jgi:hypothetical protein
MSWPRSRRASGKPETAPLGYEDIITFSLEKCLGFDPRIVAEMIRELIDRPNAMARRTNIESDLDGTAPKSFWILNIGN